MVRLLASQYSGENLEESFFILMQPILNRFDDAKDELLRGFSGMVQQSRYRLESAARELDAVSPMSILQRGYSMITDKKSGKLISSIDNVDEGAETTIRFADGTADAVITALNTLEENNEKL